MNNTDRHSTKSALQVEAERVAAANGAAILSHDADWTFFTLNDGETERTHFEWVEFRFEGFVS